MFSNFVIALVVGAGSAFWLYQKLQRSSGGNGKNAAIGAAISGGVIVIVGTIILDFVFNKF